MRRLPLHPVLFAAFPVLFLFVQNAQRVRFGKVALPLLLVLVAVGVVTALATLVLRDLRRGAVVGSGFALLSLSYGHLWTATQDDAILGFVVGRDMVLMPLFAVLGIAVVLWARTVRSLPEITSILNIVALGLFLVSAVNTTSAIARQGSSAFQANAGDRSEPVPAIDRADDDKRDIVYLIFDRYGSQPVLASRFHHDNTSFLDALRDRGFHVSDQAQSNYPTTTHSLSSSLNMRYLDDLTASHGADSDDWKPLYASLVDPAAAHFLRDQGYRYAHIGSWFDPTASDPTAHVNYHYDKRSEFTRVLIQTTIAQPLAKRVGFLKELDGRRTAHNQILFQFDSVLDAAELPGPTFTFAHFLLPHLPYTFDADGSYLTLEQERAKPWEQAYVDQLEYANGRILEVIDELQAGPDETDPIIVVQSDEGPKDERWKYGGEARWEDAGDELLRVKFGILSAQFLPGGAAIEVPDDVTPVNIFRTILSAYFGADLPALPDRNIVYGDGSEPYRFTDVTDRINP